jgi:hypothetical protein
MLRTYALAPETLRRMLRRTLWRFQWIATLSFFVFGLYLSSFGQPVQWQVALPIFLIIAVAYFLAIFFNYRQQLRLLYSVRVELDSSSITYREIYQEPLRIMRFEINAVKERKNGLLVETSDPRISMMVPFGLSHEGDKDVYATLRQWAEIIPMITRRRRIENWLYLFGFITTLFILLFANTLWVILPLGLFLFLYGVYAERRLGRKYDAAPGVLRMYNMAFSFLLFVVLMKSCLIGAIMAFSP